jgi:hypothetical protein
MGVRLPVRKVLAGEVGRKVTRGVDKRMRIM